MSERISRTKIKTATSKAGAAMSELVKLLQGIGADADLSNEEFEKIFNFLHSTLNGLEILARHDRVIAAAGRFDFDMEIAPTRPESPAEWSPPPFGTRYGDHQSRRQQAANAARPSIVTPVQPISTIPNPVGEIELPLMHAPTTSLVFKTETELPAAEWKKPTGRIAKTSPNTELAGQAVHVPIKTKTAPMTLDGVGTVGDETKKAGPVGFMDS